MRAVPVVTCCFPLPPQAKTNNTNNTNNDHDKKSINSARTTKLSTPTNNENSIKATTSSPNVPQAVEKRLWVAKNLMKQGNLLDCLSLMRDVSEKETVCVLGLLDLENLKDCIGVHIGNGDVGLVVDSLRILNEMGFHGPSLLDEKALAMLGLELSKMVKKDSLGIKECVEGLEVLEYCQFHTQDLVEPMLVFKQCIKLKDVSLALRYVSLIRNPHVWWNFLIREFGRNGDLSSALIVFRKYQSCNTTPNMYLYRDIIDACGSCRDSAMAETIFKEMLSHNVLPSTFVYNSFMNAVAADLNRTLQTFHDMQSSGAKPDIATYNILLKACRVARNAELAIDIYEGLKEKSIDGGIKMDVITYSTLIQVVGDSKNLAKVLEIKRDMEVAGILPDMITWNMLLTACANVGLVEKALVLFDEMVLSGYQPNSQCCNALLSAFVKDFQYARAFTFFKNWKEKGFYAESLKRYKKGNLPDDFAAPPSCIPKFKPTVVTYNTLMKACRSTPYLARTLMDEMKDNGIVPDNVTWSMLIDAYGNTADLQGCMQAFNNMCEAGIKPDVVTYTTLIKVCVKNKNFTKAIMMFEAMKKKNVQPNAITYNTILRGWREHGDHMQVHALLSLYEEMRKSGFPPNDEFLKGLIEEWAEGVIQKSYSTSQPLKLKGNQHQWKDENTRQKSDIIFFEKIAGLACSKSNDFTVDLRGLSETETRIVLLAVLRILREKHGPGNPIDSDLIIIIGYSGNLQKQRLESSHITKILNQELGLLVLQNRDYDQSVVAGTSSSDILSCINNRRTKAGNKTGFSVSNLNERMPLKRLPTVQRLIVPKKSLYQWVEKWHTNRNVKSL